MDQLPVPQPLTPSGHVFKPVMFGDNGLHILSDRETKFIAKFLSTGNIDLACAEIGIKKATGKIYLKKPHIQKYVEDKLAECAKSAGLTMEMLMAKLYDGLTGVVNLTGTQLEIAKIASRILRPSGGGGVMVNIQNNVSVKTESPYSGMNAAQLTEQMRERLNVVEGRATGAA